MSAKVSSTRYRPRVDANKHTGLITQQRRLRHLTCIIGRNLDPTLVPVTRHASKCSLLSLYYTIHVFTDVDKVLYKSEVIDNTLNPNWKEFDSTIFSKNPAHLRDSSIKICVWGARKKQEFRIILCYHVHFSGLVYKREQLRSGDQSYDSNSLLFRLFGGYYAAPASTLSDMQDNVLFNHIKVHADQVWVSYGKNSLMRANETLKVVNQTREQVNRIRFQMEEYIVKYEEKRKKKSRLEALAFKNNLLQKELLAVRDKLNADIGKNVNRKNDLKYREEKLKEYREELDQYKNSMKVSETAHADKRENLLKATAQLNFRRRQLAAELSYIYPIIEHPVKDGSSKREYTICGVRLPNSEEFVGEDESMLAVAVGNVCHLVYMMAKFLELPLRYPLYPMGSRSTVVDYVTDKLLDKEREFPLFSKGRERFQFLYGVFLLNKNIAQLRYHNGLGTVDLRNTLPNLKNLLEAKYGVRIIVKSGGQTDSTKSQVVTTRTLSLPQTSTPTQTSPKKLSNIDSLDGCLSPELKEKPRTENMPSGLPSVQVKAQQHQHRFISRKGTNNKFRKSQSLPETDNVSPDLIGVPFEDLIQRSIDGTIQNLSRQDRQCDTAVNNANGVTREPYEEREKTQNKALPRNDSFTRQLSDALIIPDPFDKEKDHPLTPTESLLV